MKNIFLIVMSAAFVLNISLSAQMDQKKYLYEGKIEKFRKMRNKGIALTVSGIGLSAIGTGLLISSQSDHNTEDDASLKFLYGVCAAEIGVDMIIGGIIFSAVGARKIKQYKKKLNNLSMGIIYTPEKLGISLTYRF